MAAFDRAETAVRDRGLQGAREALTFAIAQAEEQGDNDAVMIAREARDIIDVMSDEPEDEEPEPYDDSYAEFEGYEYGEDDPWAEALGYSYGEGY